MRLRTKGYLFLIALVIVLEILMLRLYIVSANNFTPYQLSDLLNFTRDNEYEGGIGLLVVAIVMQVFLMAYLVYQDRKTIEK